MEPARIAASFTVAWEFARECALRAIGKLIRPLSADRRSLAVRALDVAATAAIGDPARPRLRPPALTDPGIAGANAGAVRGLRVAP